MINQNLLLAGDDAYNLSKSLRFRKSADAYLTRTPASTTNQKTFTWSSWGKIGTLGTYRSFFSSATTNPPFIDFSFQNNDVIQLDIRLASGTYQPKTTAVFRDPSAWYHIVVAVDTTQATEANRVKLYVNNVQQTLSAVGVPQNSDLPVNTNVVHNIGRRAVASDSYFDGYLTEINFIDGQALTPSSFGETDLITGVWKPKKFSGTYGTNGFYLPFTDVATTSGSNAGLGKDFSGNGNYWNTNNISVTAGTTYDSMTDVPTLTSATTANYCVMNPLTTGSFTTLSAANLNTLGNTSSNNGNSRSTFAMQTGKWYFETTLTANNVGIYPQLGIMTTADGNRPNNGFPQAGYSNSSVNPTQSVIYMADGTKQTNSSASSYGASFTNGDVIGIAIDSDNGAIYFSKNGVFQNSGVPTSGATKTGAALTWTGGTVEHLYSVCDYNGTATATNFGQRPFSYTPPTGFVALNTFNLPTSTIVAGNKQMDATIWTGDNTTPRSIANSGSFQPDFVWIKSRSNAYQHNLYDSVRGAGAAFALSSDQTAAEGGNSNVYGFLSAFNSTGFAVTQGTAGGGGAPNGNAYTNQSGSTYVGWQWKANGTAVTNTAGTISAQVSANTTSGFSVVTYTGTGSNATVGHGLGVAPSMIIVKDRTSTNPWPVYHVSLGVQYYTLLNATSAADNSLSNYWSATAPSSTVFGLNSYGGNNQSSSNFVAYCFAEVAGYSKFGSYTGNGSTDGTFVYLGFRPRFVMIKGSSDADRAWVMLDTSRNTANVMNLNLYANASDAEATDTRADGLSNGFKVRGTGTWINNNASTYIYMAFAESPFKYSLGR